MPAILLTRPDPMASAFARSLLPELSGADIVISPLSATDWKTPGKMPNGSPVFTSARGVHGFIRAGGKATGTCWCVGPATAQAARMAGFTPRVGGGNAKTLIDAILADGENGPFLHVRGVHAVGDIAGTLKRAGCTVQEAIVYEQVAQPLSDKARALLEREKPVVLPLFSPRAANQFRAEHADRAAIPAPILVTAMSDAVLAALGDLPVKKAAVAEKPDAESMRRVVLDMFNIALRLEGDGSAQ